MPRAQSGWMEVPRRKQSKAMPWSIKVIPKVRYIFKSTSVLDLSGSKVIVMNVQQKSKRRILGLVIGQKVLTVKHIFVRCFYQTQSYRVSFHPSYMAIFTAKCKKNSTCVYPWQEISTSSLKIAYQASARFYMYTCIQRWSVCVWLVCHFEIQNRLYLAIWNTLIFCRACAKQLQNV